jgi:dTDP-4-amino-4,6-dideoxygalactose transaminase
MRVGWRRDDDGVDLVVREHVVERRRAPGRREMSSGLVETGSVEVAHDAEVDVVEEVEVARDVGPPVPVSHHRCADLRHRRDRIGAVDVPFLDIAAQDAPLRAEIDAAVAQVVASGAFVKGPAVGAFEDAFARYCGTDHAVGVGSGTDALRLVLEAVGVGPGDDVVTVPTTFVATAEAAIRLGASVTFADVDPETWMADPGAIEAALGPRTKAVVLVHLYGHVADVSAVTEIAGAHGAVVVEDAAQAHGARFDGRRVGSLGVAGAFSFFPSKNLGAYGDAGAVVTGDAALAARVRELADHGRRAKNEHAVAGWNSRLDAIQAAVLSVKLRRLDDANAQRCALVRQYRDGLADVGAVTFPALVAGTEPVHHLLVVASDRRDALREYLAQRGIATGVHYPRPLHLQPAFAHLGLGEGAFPVAEHLAGSIVSLPLWPGMAEESVDRVVGAVRAFSAGG